MQLIPSTRYYRYERSLTKFLAQHDLKKSSTLRPSDDEDDEDDSDARDAGSESGNSGAQASKKAPRKNQVAPLSSVRLDGVEAFDEPRPDTASPASTNE